MEWSSAAAAAAACFVATDPTEADVEDRHLRDLARALEDEASGPGTTSEDPNPPQPPALGDLVTRLLERRYGWSERGNTHTSPLLSSPNNVGAGR